ncbi:hypothetical protein [Bacillus multifaciens]|uniref:hypothetical protein n=1 Tax=Bacillus multifaciens TaxID=3068506 RepID=UPI0027414F12|nr:hypothetical protein [Bacillus sp. WLY-B-L8]MDP7981027.1 hypothetical protein [Bacillus sp. WLY-B-L8]
MSYWEKVLLLSEKTMENPYVLDKVIISLGSINGSFNEVVEFFIKKPDVMRELLETMKLSFETKQ